MRRITTTAEKERLAVYNDVPTEVDEIGMESVEGGEAPPPIQTSGLTLPPVMSPMNILLCAYGWGLMLFVRLYCVSGVYVP